MGRVEELDRTFAALAVAVNTFDETVNGWLTYDENGDEWIPDADEIGELLSRLRSVLATRYAITHQTPRGVPQTAGHAIRHVAELLDRIEHESGLLDGLEDESGQPYHPEDVFPHLKKRKTHVRRRLCHEPLPA